MSDTTVPPPAFGGDDAWLVSMAKADLHVHLVGSAAPRTVAALAARHHDSGVPADVDELMAFFRFRDFAHFLQVYNLVSDLVRSPEDVVTLVDGLAGDMAAQGTVYAEVTVTPVSHARAGIGRPSSLGRSMPGPPLPGLVAWSWPGCMTSRASTGGKEPGRRSTRHCTTRPPR